MRCIGISSAPDFSRAFQGSPVGPVEEMLARDMAPPFEKKPEPKPSHSNTRVLETRDQLALQLSACVQPGKQAQTQLHQLHPHSDAPRIPTTPLLTAVH